ncbi:hypothetical protein C8R45DRAFT_1165676 [Mycena sanguinolenta]|nr:hypothetical protein C8R45DRAFT_1165676 [Mycena sanguinolenta]
MPIASEESEVDIEVEEMQYSSEEEEEGRDEEEAGEDERLGQDDSDNELAEAATGHAGPLKIKLKLGAQNESIKPTSRRYARARNEDNESEDSGSEDSNSYVPAPSSGRRLTARQAVLASSGSPSHVALETSTTSKKSQYTPTEVALRKEENARKRKNMIEKRLEDEKQSRPKKRNQASQPRSDMEDIHPDAEDADSAEIPPAATMPMYRWVSTVRVNGSDTMILIVLRPRVVPLSHRWRRRCRRRRLPRQVDAATPLPSRCAVPGCDNPRKYRAVGREWGVGACGVGHLRVLEGTA